MKESKPSCDTAKKSYKNLKSELKGKYDVGKTLAKGAEGYIKMAKVVETKERVVIKFFNVIDDFDDELEVGIPHEVLVLRKLCENPSYKDHIVNVKEIVHKGEDWCVVMEFCSKGDLTKVIAKGPISEVFAGKIFRQLIEGLGFIHSAGFAHRDMKLDNALMDVCGTVRISDFGTCTSFVAEKEDEMFLFTDCIGTVCYMAPEVVNGEVHDGVKADIWSCGVLLLTLLTGEMQWDEAKTGNRKFGAFLSKGLLTKFSFSRDLKDLLLKMLTVDPKERISVKKILSHPWLDNGIRSTRTKIPTAPKAQPTKARNVAQEFNPATADNVIDTKRAIVA
eukprot:Nk52_evm26s2209 gene=Nk52_evmTU26s2209